MHIKILLLHLYLFISMCLGGKASELEKVQDSIVRIFNMDKESVGTGFVVTGEGHIGTNCHMVADSAFVTVVYRVGNSVKVKVASVIARDVGLDLAIVQVLGLELPPITLTTSLPAKGDDVIALGYAAQSDNPLAVDYLFQEAKKNPNSTLPLTEQLQQAMSIPVKRGILEDIKKFSWFEASGVLETLTPEQLANPQFIADFKANPLFSTKLEILQHTAPINHGNSGGPLLDKDSRVIGVNTAGNIDKDMSKVCLSSHITEFIRFANSYGVKMQISSSKVSIGAIGGSSGMQMLLLVVLAAFAVVMFLVVLRKPRMVMVDTVSKLVHSKRQPAGQGHSRVNIPASPQPRGPMNTPKMRLRGRDLQGRSYDIAFSDSDFQLSGGKLVIGRNNDLSQLLLSHDSVSRQHATLLSRAGAIHVEDRNSGNGTKVNGREILIGSPPVALQPGDKLTLGEVDLMFEVLN